MEGSRLWDKEVETGDITANLPSEIRTFHFFIQKGYKLCYVPFRKLFSLRVNDPTSAYIIWKGPTDFRRKNSTIVVNVFP
jgi:hypothetical protein